VIPVSRPTLAAIDGQVERLRDMTNRGPVEIEWTAA
jgi:hypothetical protein